MTLLSICPGWLGLKVGWMGERFGPRVGYVVHSMGAAHSMDAYAFGVSNRLLSC